MWRWDVSPVQSRVRLLVYHSKPQRAPHGIKSDREEIGLWCLLRDTFPAYVTRFRSKQSVKHDVQGTWIGCCQICNDLNGTVTAADI